jgi:FemAB-related protein (PEP-CTERM system-associated)
MGVKLLSPNQRWPVLEPCMKFPRLNGHSEEWCRAISTGLKHPLYSLVHFDPSSKPDAILPLMLVKSLLFGKFLVSLPYLNTGGVWANEVDSAAELVASACELADRLDVRYLELRHEVKFEHPKLTFERRDKVHMRLALPNTESELEKSFKSKLRSQIKKSFEYGLTAEWGGRALLEDFYAVFAHNMRDLGTPVFSMKLFESILNEFGDDAELCIVRRARLPIAVAIVVHRHGITEVPSASSLREHNATNANMWMYQQLLSRAIHRGSQVFDFGRSSEDSGTYRFKAQWGAQPHPAVWQYYVRKGSAEDMRPDSGSKRRLVEVWKKLPVPLTRILGPHIVRGIP